MWAVGLCFVVVLLLAECSSEAMATRAARGYFEEH
jgi:hypothetical protein